MDPDDPEVELDPGHEHQVEEPELSELGHRRIAGTDHLEPVRADQEPTDEQPDDARQQRPLEQRGPDDHDEE